MPAQRPPAPRAGPPPDQAHPGCGVDRARPNPCQGAALMFQRTRPPTQTTADARPKRRRRALLVSALSVTSVLIGYAALTIGNASAASTLLSQGRTTTASSTENAASPASAATDGNT